MSVLYLKKVMQISYQKFLRLDNLQNRCRQWDSIIFSALTPKSLYLGMYFAGCKQDEKHSLQLNLT